MKNFIITAVALPNASPLFDFEVKGTYLDYLEAKIEFDRLASNNYWTLNYVGYVTNVRLELVVNEYDDDYNLIRDEVIDSCEFEKFKF